ncbi:MAG: hypothetical protein AAGG72_04490 [Pseudomonadota bacterium]
MSGAALAADVSALIAAESADLNDGTPLTGQILRQPTATVTTYPPPAPGDPDSYNCTVIITQYSARDRDGTQITARDVKALIAADAETDPRNGDRLVVGGKTYSIVNVDTIQPGGVPLLYKCQARRGED